MIELNEELNLNNGNDIRDYFPNMGTAPKTTITFTGLVDANSRSGIRKHKDSGGEFVSMARFARESQEAYEKMEPEIQEMGNIFFRYVKGENIKCSYRLIRDVILYRNDKQLIKCMEVLRNYGRARSGGMFGISVEDDHIHVIHDCAYTTNSCRCSFRKAIQSIADFGFRSAKAKPIYKLTPTDWYDVFIYYFLRKRGTRHIWCRGENWKEPSNAQLVRWSEMYNHFEQMVGSSQDCRDHSEYKRRQDSEDGGETDNSSHNENAPKKRHRKEGRYTIIKQTVKQLLQETYISPLSALKTLEVFRQNDMLADPLNSKRVDAAIGDYGIDLTHMSLREFYNIILNAKDPMFVRSHTYGTLQESIDICVQLLKHQFDDIEDDIKKFLKTCVDILDKKVTKMNTICVHAPPSAGKNFFFDMIFGFMINVGQFHTANKTNSFPFQDGPNRRVILWNEPNYDTAVLEDMKKLLGGDLSNVKVKCQPDMAVERTPIIILTNNLLSIMHQPAFKDRVAKFTWKAAPFLKDISYKPYPLAFFEILNMYNIDF